MRLDVYHHFAQDDGAPPWAAALAAQLTRMESKMDAKLQLVLDDVAALGPAVADVSTAVTNAVTTFAAKIQELKDMIAGMQASGGATPEQLDAAHASLVDGQVKLHADVQAIADALAALAPAPTPAPAPSP